MHARLLLLAGALTLPAAAQHASVAPWLTGEQLLRKLDPVDPRDVPWTPQSRASREELAGLQTHANTEYVRGYVDAVHDATEGKTWCFNDKYQVPNPGTFWDESRWGLAQLPASERKRSAAELLSGIWHAKWPCPAGRGSKP